MQLRITLTNLPMVTYHHLTVLVLLVLITPFVISDYSGIRKELLDKIRAKYGVITEKRIQHWQDIIRNNNDKPDIEKLQLVNDFFNGARFVNDSKLWGKSDYWATPVEFLIKDAGDCEDFSIAKYFTLTQMGVDVNKLRITYVKALSLNQAHMVLAYYETPASEPIILDNINKQLKPASKRTDLKPVYSFNGENLWLARSRNEQLKAGKSAQIGLWRSLTERMQQELL